MVEFLDIFKKVKDSQPYSETAWGVKEYPRRKMSRKERNLMYPMSLSLYIVFTKTNTKNPFMARAEIEEEWAELGDWIGHGEDVKANHLECDVQVAFKEKDVLEAKAIANRILKKYGVTGRFEEFRIGK